MFPGLSGSLSGQKHLLPKPSDPTCSLGCPAFTSERQEPSHSHTCNNNKIKLRMFLATLLILHLFLQSLPTLLPSTLGDREGCVYEASCLGLEHPWAFVCVAILPDHFFPRKTIFYWKEQLVDKLSLFMLSLGDTLLEKKWTNDLVT